MFKIDTSGSTSVMPTPSAAGTPGWFQHGNPQTGTPFTVVSADWCNAIQAEILNVLTAAGISPSKTNQAQLLAALSVISRTKLAAPLELYVSTTGSDSTGTGASGSPLRTLQAAYNKATAYDLNFMQVNINIANGTYVGVFTAGAVTGIPNVTGIQFIGNVVTPASVIITPEPIGHCCFSAHQGSSFGISGVKMTGTNTTTTTEEFGFAVGQNSFIGITGPVEFGAFSIPGAGQHMNVANGGLVFISSSYKITGGAYAHLVVGTHGGVQYSGPSLVVTLTGTPAFSYFANASLGGYISFYGTTFTGAATTSIQRYYCFLLGQIWVNGAGISLLPGSTTGLVSTGGQYN